MLHKSTLIFALIILVLCVMIIYQHQRSAESIRSVEQTRLVVAYIDSLRTYLLNLDTAVRKYAESQNPADLDPGLICRQSSCPSADQLIALIGADDPRAARLAPLPSLQSALETGFGASVGIAMCGPDGETLDTLIKQADAVLYTAKREGKNTYREADSTVA